MDDESCVCIFKGSFLLHTYFTRCTVGRRYLFACCCLYDNYISLRLYFLLLHVSNHGCTLVAILFVLELQTHLNVQPNPLKTIPSESSTSQSRGEMSKLVYIHSKACMQLTQKIPLSLRKLPICTYKDSESGSPLFFELDPVIFNPYQHTRSPFNGLGRYGGITQK